MTGVITILLAGTGTGPFYLYSDVDGFVMPFASAISKAVLLSGYPTDQIPDGTTMIRVQSLNDVCNNYVDISIIPITTTTTTTIEITTTTTTTVSPTTTTTTTLAPEDYTYYEAEYYSCVAETCTGGPVAAWIYNVDPTLVINNYYYDSVTDKSYYLLSSGQTYAAYVLAGSPPAVETDAAFASIAYVTCTCLPLAPP